MTIGTSFAVRNVDMGNVVVKLQIWDLAGQPHFGSVRPLFYQGSTGIVYVYSVTDRASFEHMAGWMEEVRNHAGDITGILIGNKSDLIDERVVSEEEARAFSKSVGLDYLETSAKTDVNVGDAFRLIAEKIIKTKWPGWEPPVGIEEPVTVEPKSTPIEPEEPEMPEMPEIPEVTETPESEPQPEVSIEPVSPADDDFSSFQEEPDEKPDETMPEVLEELLTLEKPEPEEKAQPESPSTPPDISAQTDIALEEKSTSTLLELTDVDYKELPLEEFEVRVIGVLRRLSISENGVFGSYILSLVRQNERDVVIQSLESLQED